MIAQLYPLLLALLILAVLSALLIYRWRQSRRHAARQQDQLKRAAYRRQRMATLQELVGDDVLALLSRPFRTWSQLAGGKLDFLP